MDLAQFTWTVVPFLASLVVAGQIIALALLGVLIYQVFTKKTVFLTAWVGDHGLLLMLIVALTAMVGSLYFSEVSGWNPCKYCWIQRILMYPQVLLLAIALWQRDKQIAKYIFALSLIGAGYAAYHFYIQMYDIIASPTNPATPCDASGESCVKTPFVQFGYITIPMMALTGFAMNAICSFVMMKSSKSSAPRT